jgi:uncharacterized membrane protein YoaT (DUF817 family)
LSFGREVLAFVAKQVSACLFGILLLGLLVLTFQFYPKSAPLARYDFLVIACITIQAALIGLKLESWDEALVILAFHIVGTLMELYKTHMGSWNYPEASVLRIGSVPLFSGFMYACVGSYLARTWRLFDLRFRHYPPVWTTALLAAAIYANFFTHHFLPDMRLFLLAATALLFWRTSMVFTALRAPRRLTLMLGFLFVALAIWAAENIGTFARAWIYPHQAEAWKPVKWTKIGAWYLLTIISFVLVSLVHRPQAPDDQTAGSASARPASR